MDWTFLCLNLKECTIYLRLLSADHDKADDDEDALIGEIPSISCTDNVEVGL